MKKELEELNISLEDKVEQRTEMLQKSLNEIRDLKEKQDGDYFLTSLLLKPLNIVEFQSKQIQVDHFLKQKKNFKFKKFSSEIGGDICSVSKVILEDKSYIAFINGDAMGKSIQGAGGAIVIGTAFKTIITRTQKISKDFRTPEKWLNDTFTELQNIFISFDGSMLASAVLGLIEERTGKLYFINAEHPYTVLFRDGKACFIEDIEKICRKIGFSENSDQLFSIQYFEIQEGDSIIIGSDGRDDIAITHSLDKKVINEDEKLFLRVVENAKGDLKEIYNLLSNQGEITDDLSLMKFTRNIIS